MEERTQIPEFSWKGKSILIVEDDDPTAYLLQEVLKKTGAEIKHVEDGLKAVDYMRANPTTDLILMDVHLPDKDGFTAAREIRGFTEGVVIIAQTSYAFSMEHNENMESNCDDFFTKPLDMVRLLETIELFFQRRAN